MSTIPPRVLLVEDTPTQAELARTFLSGLGYDIRIAPTAGAALQHAREWRPDAMLLDLQLPDFSGFDLMRQLRQEQLDCAVIVATANGSVNTAVEAMREGAVDFLVKPFARARLVTTVGNVLEKRVLATELKVVRSRLDRQGLHGFIGASAAMQAVYRTIESVAASKASVFIAGESGTGKELAAEAVHLSSPRRSREFVPINCGAIPRDLLESEIFGHVKGAFTGATSDRVGAAKIAHCGTLFLDEIGEMPLEMQVKLLRFVQTGTLQPVGSSRSEKVDVRFVCATNRDPVAEVEAGRFREDLFYRLYVVPLELPPLRSREQDVLLIARRFLKQFAREENRRFSGFSADAEAALLSYPWPGNVRQLQNVVRNVVVLNDGDTVTAEMLPRLVLRGGAAKSVQPSTNDTRPPLVPPVGVAEMQFDAAQETIEAAARSSAELELLTPRRLVLAEQETQPFDSNVQAPAIARVQAEQPFPQAPAPAAADAGADDRAGGETGRVSDIVPLAVMERRMILAALERTGNDVPRAAALLEVNPSTIYRKLQAWRADRDRSSAM